MDEINIYANSELIKAEMIQLSESGYLIDSLEEFVKLINTDKQVDDTKLIEFYSLVADLEQNPNWQYSEPSNFQEIEKQRPKLSNLTGTISESELYDKVLGGLLGRCAGCTLGRPLEVNWDYKSIEHYLRLANAYPLSNYVPLLNPLPDGIELCPWGRVSETTLGNISKMVPDDDTDYTIGNLVLLEKKGMNFSSQDIAEFWLESFPFWRVHTAERVAYKNLVNKTYPPMSAQFRNPYREWIGAQIRADTWGYVTPGNPKLASELAWRDANISHTGNGIYGEIWVASMISAAFLENSPKALIEIGLEHIPSESRFAEAIHYVIDLHSKYSDWNVACRNLHNKIGKYYSVDLGFHSAHVIPNACMVALSLLYGNGDYGKSVTTAVMGGYDTDCNGATVGSIVGVIVGAKNIPSLWVEPLGDTLESYIPDNHTLKISELAYRFIDQINKLA